MSSSGRRTFRQSFSVHALGGVNIVLWQKHYKNAKEVYLLTREDMIPPRGLLARPRTTPTAIRPQGRFAQEASLALAARTSYGL